jgi:hypothetical protein
MPESQAALSTDAIAAIIFTPGRYDESAGKILRILCNLLAQGGAPCCLPALLPPRLRSWEESRRELVRRGALPQDILRIRTAVETLTAREAAYRKTPLPAWDDNRFFGIYDASDATLLDQTTYKLHYLRDMFKADYNRSLRAAAPDRQAPRLVPAAS